jgi:hypothetical protein
MGGRTRYGPAPRRPKPQRLWTTETEEDDPNTDYSGIVVYDDQPQFVDTGLVFPDGEPIYAEKGAPLGFPITSDREEEID